MAVCRRLVEPTVFLAQRTCRGLETVQCHSGVGTLYSVIYRTILEHRTVLATVQCRTEQKQPFLLSVELQHFLSHEPRRVECILRVMTLERR